MMDHGCCVFPESLSTTSQCIKTDKSLNKHYTVKIRAVIEWLGCIDTSNDPVSTMY